ncbi:hypothetical protein HYP58_gp74 [Vibrio phage 1.097.O._10N.286.49.B3]|uniref:Nucleotide modification associated domain-containing protein n=1 Tax=Vibrio phage 1.097.O._10N.286.49.B3 TaxID=1881383 RepID=A0A2I7R0Q1_9CAUD|nr:hypothetical protein HYP58_gp74 [Vibrio phage 1.097.O._10N.286.49.B3]AUR87220.1 hypothetical protein NVP1097O_74 [Vibrio phage 1.097.O._10N.286.49.B3]
MGSIRLNKTTRTDIVDRVMKAWLLKNKEPKRYTREQYTKDRDALIREKVLGESQELKGKAHKAGIAEEDLILTSYRRVVMSDSSGKRHQWTLYVDSNEAINRCGALDLDLDSELTAKIHKLRKKCTNKRAQDAFKAWETKRINYRKDVENVVAGVNTTGQLREVWPEVEKFLPEALNNPSSGIKLPTVSIKALNAAIA